MKVMRWPNLTAGMYAFYLRAAPAPETDAFFIDKVMWTDDPMSMRRKYFYSLRPLEDISNGKAPGIVLPDTMIRPLAIQPGDFLDIERDRETPLQVHVNSMGVTFDNGLKRKYISVNCFVADSFSQDGEPEEVEFSLPFLLKYGTLRNNGTFHRDKDADFLRNFT